MAETLDCWYKGSPVIQLGSPGGDGAYWIGPGTPVFDFGQEEESTPSTQSFPFNFPSGGFPSSFPFR
jgi:hypothetical protein